MRGHGHPRTHSYALVYISKRLNMDCLCGIQFVRNKRLLSSQITSFIIPPLSILNIWRQLCWLLCEDWISYCQLHSCKRSWLENISVNTMSVVMNEVNIGHNHGYIPIRISLWQNWRKIRPPLECCVSYRLKHLKMFCRGKRRRGCISSNKSRQLYTQSKEVRCIRTSVRWHDEIRLPDRSVYHCCSHFVVVKPRVAFQDVY